MPTSLSERGYTGGVDGDIAPGQVQKMANVNEIADIISATSGRHLENETETRIFATVNVADENADTTAEMMRRPTNVDGRQVGLRIPSKARRLTDVAALLPL